MTGTAVRIVNIASAFALAAAAVVLLLPVGGSADAGTQPPPPVLAGPGGAGIQPSADLATDSTGAQIVAGNVFSSSRRAPLTRFTPPAAGAVTDDPAPATPSTGVFAAGAERDPEESERIPALYGIVSIDGARRALLSLRAGSPPRLLEPGESDGGYRVVSIDADRVVLRSAAGSQTVRLTRRASQDTSKNLP